MSQAEFFKKIAEVQSNLVAPKNQYNSFGKYNYRSCEDILDGIKNLNSGLVVTINDEIVIVGEGGNTRFYVKATATVSDGVSSISNSSFAREALTKKGMDESQITGSASSYARKYALNGLFCIDDTKDADTRKPVNSSSENDIETIANLISETGSDLKLILGHYKVKAIKDMSEDVAAHCINALTDKKEKAIRNEG